MLRDAGLDVITLAQHYGMPRDQSVTDIEWLEECSHRGWVALMKDGRIRRRPAERRAITEHSVRCFCLARGDLTSAEAAGRYLRNLQRILIACTHDGPYVYAVHSDKIVRLAL